MDRKVFVYADLNGQPHFVGRLWTLARKGRETSAFEYEKTWLAHPLRFSLEPALQLGPGPYHAPAERPLFGAISDSAPDRWGRVLMRRAERRLAEREKRAGRTLREIDYLLLVSDEARAGAFRFSEEEGGPFLAALGSVPIPPLVDLARLLSASERVLNDSDTEDDLRLLLAPGSSLGGARPKASVRDRMGRLLIAKFPNKGDDFNVVLWEALALTLAKKAGISVPGWRLEMAGKRPVLLLRRFDRSDKGRIPFLSAMSMLGARDGDPHSYMEFVDALRQHGASPKEDMHELWRRIVFSIMISNTDDHLRNHGFLYAGGAGWRLSPAYDLNPVPVEIKPRVLSTTITLDDGTASLNLAYEVAPYFELDVKAARRIVKEVSAVTAKWRTEAAKLGISKPEISRMASAFEHDDRVMVAAG
jgi:serine/threonine-protein kinase HipA